MEILARAVGRRKEAVAQVQIVRGTGQFIINDKTAKEYLHDNLCSLKAIKEPFSVLDNTDGNSINLKFETLDTRVKVKGGGLIGQAEAIKLGISRALCDIESLSLDSNNSGSLNNNDTTLQGSVRKQLKTKGFLTQDARVKERRKYGLKKARKATQYHKR
uniref:Small ribosomal subunit protein uS9c n=1 Tax=Chlamydomonas moewusii TaxID=3054 RepID=B2X2C7_CHLMO|nr:ribosomal protein S9 [Chlamydomonas moewusii]